MLPDRSQANTVTDTHFKTIHQFRNIIAWRNCQQKVYVIRHEHKAMQKKWMQFLDAIEDVNGFAGIDYIGENRTTVFYDGRYKHEIIGLDGVMTNGHGDMIEPAIMLAKGAKQVCLAWWSIFGVY